MPMAWSMWIGLMAAISIVFWFAWRIADKIERDEQREMWEQGVREQEARQYEEAGMLREAQWIREGRKW